MLALCCSLGSGTQKWLFYHSAERLLDLLGNVLQLTDLFVELRNVVFDDVGQFLDLHRFVIKDSFPLAEESEFLQLGVGVGDVLTDALGDVDEVRFLLDGLEAPHGSTDLAASQCLERRPELRGPVPAAVHHRTETQPGSPGCCRPAGSVHLLLLARLPLEYLAARGLGLDCGVRLSWVTWKLEPRLVTT